MNDVTIMLTMSNITSTHRGTAMDAARSPVESRSVEGALTDMEGEGEGVAVDVGVTAASISRQALLLHK